MNTPPYYERRAIRTYNEAKRDAIHAVERDTITRDPRPPEPCNFCAHDDAPVPVDRFAELAQVLGRYWLLWLITFTGLCVVSALLAVALVAEMVAKP